MALRTSKTVVSRTVGRGKSHKAGKCRNETSRLHADGRTGRCQVACDWREKIEISILSLDEDSSEETSNSRVMKRGFSSDERNVVEC